MTFPDEKDSVCHTKLLEERLCLLYTIYLHVSECIYYILYIQYTYM